jgi:hypothetical protein
MPPISRPPGLAGLFADTTVLTGRVQLNLTNMSMSLLPAFTAKMGLIAALDQLPDVFADFNTVKQATASVPITLIVHYSSMPLFLSLGAAILALLAIICGVLLLTRAREYSMSLDGRSQRIRLRPFESRVFQLSGNRAAVVTGRIVGKHRLVLRNGLAVPKR